MIQISAHTTGSLVTKLKIAGKDLIEKRIQAGEIELSENALQEPAPHEQSSMISHSIISHR